MRTTRKVSLRELPDDSFSFAALELAEALDAAMEHGAQFRARFKWESNLKQLAFKTYLDNPISSSPIQHFLLEGSVRSGKTIAAIAWFYTKMDENPGMQVLGMRRTQGQLIAQLYTTIKSFNEKFGIKAFYKKSNSSGPTEITYANGSRWILWSSESVLEDGKDDTARGLGGTEYAGALLDEVDKIHPQVIDTIPMRLCQQLPALKVRLMAYIMNPTVTTHPINRKFKEHHKVIPEMMDSYQWMKFTLEDNAANLPPGFIQEIYNTYRRKPSLFRRMVLGMPGPEIIGEPLYGPYFDRTLHIAQQSFVANWTKRRMWEDGDLCLCIDFGFHHPALTVIQDVDIAKGTFRQLRFLAAWLGEDITLKPFMGYYLPKIQQLFPNANIKTYVDQAGKQKDGRGVSDENALDVLRSLGLNPQYRSADVGVGVDLIIDLLQTVTKHDVLGVQPAIIIEPDPDYTNIIVEGMETGYCQDPNVRKDVLKPFDDNYYIHVMDSIRYGVMGRRKLNRTRDRQFAQGNRSNYTMVRELEGAYLPRPMTEEELYQMEGGDIPSASYF